MQPEIPRDYLGSEIDRSRRLEVIENLSFGYEESRFNSADCKDVDNALVNNCLFTWHAMPGGSALALLCIAV